MNISETNGSVATKFYLKHHKGGGKAALGFGPDRIRTLVSMATESSHWVLMEKTVSPLFLGCFSSYLFQIQPLVSMVTYRVMMGKNGVSTFSRLFFIRRFSYLQVTMTCMRAQTRSNFGLIGPSTAELAALERLKKIPIGL